MTWQQAFESCGRVGYASNALEANFLRTDYFFYICGAERKVLFLFE
jgi:hypothetical protein